MSYLTGKTKTKDVKILLQISLEKIGREHVRITDCFTECLFANICWLSELLCGVVFGGYCEVDGKQNVAGRSISRNKEAQRPHLLVVVGQIHFLCGRLDSHHEVMQRLQLDALKGPCPNSHTKILDKSMGAAIFRP